VSSRDVMRAWMVTSPGHLDLADVGVPRTGPGELLVRVVACGVCRTDLHVLDGDLPPHKTPVVPGHEVVGEVVERGSDAPEEFAPGSRVGIPWLRGTCGTCPYCRRDQENLCPASVYTGWDADGGYAEFATVPAGYAYRLPSGYSDHELAPLLCAGIIGYQALARAELPSGGRLGIYGFGASAHLTAQIAIAQGASVHVLTRSTAAQQLALDLGAESAGDAYGTPPVPLDSAILFAPVGDLVPLALESLDRGGTLSIAGIHLSDVPPLNYERHLFYERSLRSVTANTRSAGREFLRLAAALPLRIETAVYDFLDARRALQDLAADRVRGVAVLDISGQDHP
jgi:propanol-preferring alcohol dehydrogenase